MRRFGLAALVLAALAHAAPAPAPAPAGYDSSATTIEYALATDQPVESCVAQIFGGKRSAPIRLQAGGTLKLDSGWVPSGAYIVCTKPGGPGGPFIHLECDNEFGGTFPAYRLQGPVQGKCTFAQLTSDGTPVPPPAPSADVAAASAAAGSAATVVNGSGSAAAAVEAANKASAAAKAVVSSNRGTAAETAASASMTAAAAAAMIAGDSASAAAAAR